MGRPREFDVDAVLSTVVGTFWRGGYDGSSLRDLTEATGVGRQSLYLAFGDKQAMYLAALKRYRELFQVPLLDTLGSAPPEQVRDVLRSALTSLADDSCAGPSGCLLVNASTERAAEDPQVRRAVAEAMRALEDAIAEALSRAQDAGALGPELDVRRAARSLLTTIQGLRVLAPVVDRDVLLDSIDAALGALH